MQQDGSITFERVIPTSPIETWHLVVALLLFAAIVGAVVRRSGRRSEKNSGTLDLRN
jgi:hypothetical protein